MPISASKPNVEWSDLAIMRTTPALLGLFSLVALWAHDTPCRRTPLVPRDPLPGASKAALHIQRCHCRGVTRNLAPSGFFHVPGKPGQH